jgi:6-phosphogluconate dehydrogenase
MFFKAQLFLSIVNNFTQILTTRTLASFFSKLKTPEAVILITNHSSKRKEKRIMNFLRIIICKRDIITD